MVMRASAKVVAVRVALLAIAVAGVAVAFVAHRGGDASARRGQAAATHAYACPMHPQVVAPVPGECPICRMALELQQSAAQAGPAPGPAGSARGATFSLPPRTARLNDDDHVIAKRRRVSGPIVAPASIDGDRGGFVLLYEGDAVAGQQARFQPAARPAAAAGIDVRFTSEPPLRQDGGVVKMRFALARRRRRPARPVGSRSSAARSMR